MQLQKGAAEEGAVGKGAAGKGAARACSLLDFTSTQHISLVCLHVLQLWR